MNIYDLYNIYKELTSCGYSIKLHDDYISIAYDYKVITLSVDPVFNSICLEIRGVDSYNQPIGIKQTITPQMFSYLGDRKLYYDMIFKTIIHEYLKKFPV